MEIARRSRSDSPIRWCAALAAASLLVAACSGGGSSVSPADTTSDTVPEAIPDTTRDTTRDTVPEATPGTTPDTTPDSVPQTTPDTTVAFVPSGVMCPPTPEGRIAYELVVDSDEIGDRSVVRVVRPDGSSDSLLFGDEAYLGANEPTWSPDGTRVAVLAGDGQTLIVRCDGTIEAVLNFGMQTASYPIGIDGSYASWSPDGSTLSLVSDEGVHLVDPADPDAGLPIPLDSDLTVVRGRASWSPDGDRLVFGASDRDENTDIYVVGTDGSGLTRLTTDPGDDYQPAWSPDGSTIAFRSTRDGRLWLMAADGSGQEPLFPDSDTGLAYQPSWSPDGTQLVYVRGDVADTRVHIVGADGSGDRQLTANDPAPRAELWPVWVSP